MLTLLHISDIHFGPPYVPEVGEALIGAAAEFSADIVVASGDFTQRARREQFAAARAFLDRLPAAPRIVVPGNHDVPLYRVHERLFSPYALYKEYMSSELDAVHRHEEAVIVSLNTTSPLRTVVNGRVRREQLELVSDAFASAGPEQARIVVAHHHFAPAPDYEARDDVMPHAREALDVFRSLGVELVLGGHLHRAYIGNSLDLYPGQDREHGIIIVQAGTATSRRGRAREREKNTFNLIRVGEEFIRITHYMYFDEAGGFAPISRHIFPRAGRRWLTEARGAPAGGED